MSSHTRIKICGLTRADDVSAAVVAGVDALGFVFYPHSARYVTAKQAAQLMLGLPPFVSTVGLFVNANSDQVAATAAQVPISILQFHGDETSQECAAIAARVRLPFLRAVRIQADVSNAPGVSTCTDLLKYELEYRLGSSWFAGLLLDAYSTTYGGSGKVFDWSVIPEELAPRVVLSGGLSAHNATEAVLRVRPYAIDVSSGVEQVPGIKDAAKIFALTEAVRRADAALDTLAAVTLATIEPPK